MENKKQLTKQCVKCKEELGLDNFNVCKKNSDGLQSYCRACQSDYKYNDDDAWYKTYINNCRGYYLYVVLDKSDKVLYVGATEDIKCRIEQQHVKGNSHLHELMLSDKWECIKYLDVGNLVDNREEMLFLENILIKLYNTEYNKKKNIIKDLDKLRELQLLSEVHSLTQKWEIYMKNEHKKRIL